MISYHIIIILVICGYLNEGLNQFSFREKIVTYKLGRRINLMDETNNNNELNQAAPEQVVGGKGKWVFAYDDKPPKQARLYKHWHGNDREILTVY